MKEERHHSASGFELGAHTPLHISARDLRRPGSAWASALDVMQSTPEVPDCDGHDQEDSRASKKRKLVQDIPNVTAQASRTRICYSLRYCNQLYATTYHRATALALSELCKTITREEEEADSHLPRPRKRKDKGKNILLTRARARRERVGERLKEEMEAVLRQDPYRLEKHVYYCRITFRCIFHCYDSRTICFRMNGPGFRDVRLANQFSRAVRSRWGDEPDLRMDTEERAAFLQNARQIVDELEQDPAYANSELVLHWGGDAAHAGDLEQVVLFNGCVPEETGALSHHVYERLTDAVRAAGLNCVRLRTRKCGARCRNVKGKDVGLCAAYSSEECAAAKQIVLSALDGSIVPECWLSGTLDRGLRTAYVFCGGRSSEGVDEATYMEVLSSKTWAWIEHATRFYQKRDGLPAYTSDGVTYYGHTCEILQALGLRLTVDDMREWFTDGMRLSRAVKHLESKEDSHLIMLLPPGLKQQWVESGARGLHFWGCRLCGSISRSTNWQQHASSSRHAATKAEHASGMRPLFNMAHFAAVVQARCRLKRKRRHSERAGSALPDAPGLAVGGMSQT